MKVHPLAIVAISLGTASAFVHPQQKRTSAFQLEGTRDNNDVFKPAAAAFAGLTIASQVAFGVLPATGKGMKRGTFWLACI